MYVDGTVSDITKKDWLTNSNFSINLTSKENDVKGEDPSADNNDEQTKVQGESGEENENVLWSGSNSKLFELIKKKGSPTYVARGVGELRLNRDKQTRALRFVMRTEKLLLLLLNCSVNESTHAEIVQGKSVSFVGVNTKVFSKEEGEDPDVDEKVKEKTGEGVTDGAVKLKPAVYAVRCEDAESAKALVNAIGRALKEKENEVDGKKGEEEEKKGEKEKEGKEKKEKKEGEEKGKE